MFSTPTGGIYQLTCCRGAVNVGLHILAYNGRDDGLFAGAIAQSGATAGVGLINPTTGMQSYGLMATIRLTTKL